MKIATGWRAARRWRSERSAAKPRRRSSHAVDRAERHRLALVAPARERQRLAARAELREELGAERALPDPRHPVYVDHHAAALREAGLERVLEQLELADPPDEGCLAHDPGRGPPSSPLAPGRSKRLQDRLPARASQRIAGEELHAEHRELLGRVLDDGPGRRRVLGLLLGEDHAMIAAVGASAGERLVEDRAHRVPVAGLGDRVASRLLGRHIGGGPDDHVEVEVGLVGPLDQPEVEQHHATLAGDEHVRGLDVPVELARGVEGVHALGELAERRPQARQVEPAGSRLGASGLGLGREVLERPLLEREGALGVVGDVGQRARRRRGGRPARGRDLGGGDPASDMAEEIDALDELHREIPLLPLDRELVEGDQVGMGDPGERTELVLEAVERPRAQPAERLERHLLIASEVARAIDDAEAPGAQAAVEAVPPAGEVHARTILQMLVATCDGARSSRSPGWSRSPPCRSRSRCSRSRRRRRRSSPPT